MRMAERFTEKELRVLRVLSENSDRPQKELAVLTGMKEPEFSRTKRDLISRGIIKKYTIQIDHRKLGFPDVGVLFASVFDKKSIMETVNKILLHPEAIAVFEVFGQDFDLVIKLMCRDNEHLRHVTEEITSLENVKAGEHTFTIIYSRVFRDEPGVPVDLIASQA